MVAIPWSKPVAANVFGATLGRAPTINPPRVETPSAALAGTRARIAAGTVNVPVGAGAMQRKSAASFTRLS
jgi:hypothetical protein